LVNDSYLYNFASSADSHAFAEHFGCSNDNACVFENLSGSATLVAPKPIRIGDGVNSDNRYGHIAAFCRTAPTNQIVEVWRLVAQTFQEQLVLKTNDRPIWFSTAGTGIAWLHFRFDDRPKYYLYRPFKTESGM
jgi:hypothetical protein